MRKENECLRLAGEIEEEASKLGVDVNIKKALVSSKEMMFVYLAGKREGLIVASGGMVVY